VCGAGNAGEIKVGMWMGGEVLCRMDAGIVWVSESEIVGGNIVGVGTYPK
jgi:hypothetical protein